MNKLLKFRRGRGANERGQVLVIGLFVVVGLTMVALTVANVGMMVAEKIHLQDAVDAAAYSAGVVEARYMNLSAYVNRAMVANYNSMAFNTAVWALIDADDHGLALIAMILYLASIVLTIIGYGSTVDSVADAVHAVHKAAHTMNHYANEYFAQDENDLNQYIEMYNINILTMYQGMLYAAMQSSRFEVIDQVAKKMDEEIVTTTMLGLGAEAVSYDELAKAVDWVIKDPDKLDEPFKTFQDRFNKMAGEDDDTDDHEYMLAAVTEASLDKFTAGRDRDGDFDQLRRIPNISNIFPASGTIETIIEVACEILTLSLGTCDADVNLSIGASMREGQEDLASQSHVPFIARRRYREVNLFGIDFTFDIQISDAIEFDLGDIGGFSGAQGHTSAEKKADVKNRANLIDILNDFDFARAFQCILSGCSLNEANISAAELMGVIPPIVVDDHWDGSFDDLYPDNFLEIYPPGGGQAAGIEYAIKVYTEGKEEGVPKYDWQVDLPNVGIPHFHYDTSIGQERPDGNSRSTNNNRLTGPSIAVVGVKSGDDVNSIRGLGTERYPAGIGNAYSITAIARSQVYYLKNPNRPDEKPSLFNPHWVARLAPLDEEDVPVLLRKGLPFVAGTGTVIEPTH